MKPDACPVCQGCAEAAGVCLGRYSIAVCARCGLRFAPEAWGVLVDYSSVYESNEYQSNQVDDLVAWARNPAHFAEIGTYRPFFRSVKPFGKKRLLDVGCGVGRFCLAASDKGWTVTGIDHSEKAVEIARKYTTLDISTEGLDTLAGRGNCFEAITAFEVLEHLPDPVNFVRKIKDCLVPGGRFFATVPNWAAPSVQKAIRPDWLPPIHLCFHTAGSLARLVAETGLSRISGGIIRTEVLPGGLKHALGWLRNRLLFHSNEPLGLWIQAEKNT